MTARMRADLLLGLGCLLAGACGSGSRLGGGSGSGGLGAAGGSGGTGGAGGGGATLQVAIAGRASNNLDLLFMIDNSSSMTTMQQKLLAQIPAFFHVLQSLPGGLPNLHVAVVSSDMGAPGDSTTSIGCTTSGDNGQFQFMPGRASTCATTTLASGSTFLSDVSGQANFTNPIDQVVQCVGALGANGCGFEHQLASIDRALGADGAAPPASNAAFLRPDAFLGIVILTNEDDCSAPPNTTIFSLNGGAQSITNPDGPIMNYRCNGGPRGGHVCKDPATGQPVVPPLTPPSDAAGNPPILQLADCRDNDPTSALVPVAQLVADIKRLKADPDNQIAVVAIAAPPDPYGVEWVPPFSPPPDAPGQLWPQVMHSCGAAGADNVNPQASMHTSDGSFGDPAVRISQFVQSFRNSLIASICDASYQSSMAAIATKLGQLIAQQSCVSIGTIQLNASSNPACTVTNHLWDVNGNTKDVQVRNCTENGNVAPCWTLQSDAACPAGSDAFKLLPDQATMNAASFSSTLKCSLCEPGSVMPGC